MKFPKHRANCYYVMRYTTTSPAILRQQTTTRMPVSRTSMIGGLLTTTFPLRYKCQPIMMHEQSLVERLRIRAQIRRQISTRKSVQEGKPDRIADLLEEAAEYIETHCIHSISDSDFNSDKYA